MAMLRLGDAGFSSGRARFVDNLLSETHHARIYVRFRVEDIAETYLALLDTGAEYSVIAPQVAQEAGLDAADGREIVMSHRSGTGNTPGKLVRASVRLCAEEGEDLIVDATVFVPSHAWPAGRNFIGYTGLLEAVRLALDPQSNDVYFGGYNAPAL